MNSSEVSSQLVTAQRLAALSRVGAALMSERDEAHLFYLIAETARDLIGATFAALTLRPVNEEGEPLVLQKATCFILRLLWESRQSRKRSFGTCHWEERGCSPPSFAMACQCLSPMS
jgi:hypothetical protein